MAAPLIIAIDGFSSCGKSTLAKDLANRLDILHIDSGAMYRAVTYYFLNNDIDFNDPQAVEEALPAIDIHFDTVRGKEHLYLNGTDVEENIRSQQVSDVVSEVAAISSVRRCLVRLQRKLATGQSIVMDGRDIGTVVFPTARVKLFLTADFEERANRRYSELRNKGMDVKKDYIYENLKKRDQIDSTREDSPLRKADDAILIDNTEMTRKQQLQKALEIVKAQTQEEA